MGAKLGARAQVSSAAAVWHISVLLGLLHGVVDLATVSSVFRVSRGVGDSFLSPFAIIVGYDVLAFALQTPLGALADRFKAQRAAALLGLVSTLAAVQMVSYSAAGTMALAGIGNALFHLGAGAIVLARAGGRAGPAGLFVAPGAFGLATGIYVGKTGTGSLFPIAMAVGVAIAITLFISTGPTREAAPPPRAATNQASAATAIALLLVSVFIRSFIGFGGSYQCPKIDLVLWGLPVAAMCGKAVGGFIADRFGWISTSVGALLLSAPLLAFSQGQPAVVLPAMFLFQTTMPVTLTAVYRLMPERPGTAFGLPCLALIAGALPTFFPWGRGLYGAPAFFGLCVLSAAALYGALRPKVFHDDGGVPVPQS